MNARCGRHGVRTRTLTGRNGTGSGGLPRLRMKCFRKYRVAQSALSLVVIGVRRLPKGQTFIARRRNV